ncbi:MAG: phage tail tape measure protein, partial [Vicingus serpentipes]|nr:phage tail tape measure protein [Vicingus serpentipes]
MPEKSEKRRLYIYINGKEVENSLRSLSSEARKLRNEFAAASDPKEQKRLAKELQNVESKVVSLRSQAKGLGGTFSSLKKAISSNVFAMVGWTAVITGLIAGFGDAYQTVKRFDEGVANLQKVTGETKKGARELALEISSIKTKTSVDALLELAVAAGRLNLKGKELIEFTENTDKVFVALGDSLDGSAEDIGLTLGKIASSFNLEQKYGIGNSIERIGSVLNELGANTKATEGPIVDFTNRLAGVAGQADITLPQIAALGALFDANGQSIEIAATTFQKLLPEMGKNVQKFADVAGVPIEEFRDKLENDAFGALMLVAKGAQSNKSGLTALSDTLKNYGIDSARAASIVTILSSKQEELAEYVELSNRALEENTSIANENAIKQQTLTAKGEILTKTWDEFIISLDGSESVIGNVDKNLLDFFTNAIIGLKNLGATFDVMFGGVRSSSEETKKAILKDFRFEDGFKVSILTDAFDKMNFKQFGKNLAEAREKFIAFGVKHGETVEDMDALFNQYVKNRVEAEKELRAANKETTETIVKQEDESTKKITEEQRKELEKRAKEYIKEEEKLQSKIAEIRNKVEEQKATKDD